VPIATFLSVTSQPLTRRISFLDKVGLINFLLFYKKKLHIFVLRATFHARAGNCDFPLLFSIFWGERQRLGISRRCSN